MGDMRVLKVLVRGFSKIKIDSFLKMSMELFWRLGELFIFVAAF